MPSALYEDSAPSACLDHLKAQAAPTHLRAPPERPGSLRWPQEPALGRPKVEDFPLSTTRRGHAQRQLQWALQVSLEAKRETVVQLLLDEAASAIQLSQVAGPSARPRPGDLPGHLRAAARRMAERVQLAGRGRATERRAASAAEGGRRPCEYGGGGGVVRRDGVRLCVGGRGDCAVCAGHASAAGGRSANSLWGSSRRGQQLRLLAVVRE